MWVGRQGSFVNQPHCCKLVRLWGGERILDTAGPVTPCLVGWGGAPGAGIPWLGGDQWWAGYGPWLWHCALPAPAGSVELRKVKWLLSVHQRWATHERAASDEQGLQRVPNSKRLEIDAGFQGVVEVDGTEMHLLRPRDLEEGFPVMRISQEPIKAGRMSFRHLPGPGRDDGNSLGGPFLYSFTFLTTPHWGDQWLCEESPAHLPPQDCGCDPSLALEVDGAPYWMWSYCYWKGLGIWSPSDDWPTLSDRKDLALAWSKARPPPMDRF